MPGFATSIKAFIEKTRERFHIGEPSFRPTPNARNPAMMKEVCEFATVMLNFRDGALRYGAALDKFLGTYPSVAQKNLPRVWTAVEGRPLQAEPRRPNLSHEHPIRIGGDFDEALIQDCRTILKIRLDGVVGPINHWLRSLEDVKVRMARLEELKLLVDARRRTIKDKYSEALRHADRLRDRRRMRSQGSRPTTSGSITTASHTENVNAAGGPPRAAAAASPFAAPAGGSGGQLGGPINYLSLEGAEAAAEYWRGGGDRLPSFPEEEEEEDMAGGTAGDVLENLGGNIVKQDLVYQAMHQKRKLCAVTGSFLEQEQVVFEQLKSLVMQATWLKTHIAATFIIIKETMQACLIAMGPCKQPLPTCTFERCGSITEDGALGTCEGLANEVPPSLVHLLRAGDLQLATPFATPRNAPQTEVEEGVLTPPQPVPWPGFGAVSPPSQPDTAVPSEGRRPTRDHDVFQQQEDLPPQWQSQHEAHEHIVDSAAAPVGGGGSNVEPEQAGAVEMGEIPTLSRTPADETCAFTGSGILPEVTVDGGSVAAAESSPIQGSEP